jgi:membrane protease YdiL (CAAX protease family)
MLSSTPPPEDPIWTGWDVLLLAIFAFFSVVVFVFLVTYAAQRLLYPRMAFSDVAKYPIVAVLGELLAELLVLVGMISMVKGKGGQSFWKAIRWNWPRNWPRCLFAGFVLAFGLQGVAHLLPIPKELPIDRFFQTTSEAWVLSVFGITVAPLLEELFFRGFLYPVLARRLGIVAAVILTAVPFGLIHAAQLGWAWGPVLVIFLVGLTLTITRAVTKSVASGVLIHIAYNATISVLIFIATDGFRHLEKLNQ